MSDFEKIFNKISDKASGAKQRYALGLILATEKMRPNKQDSCRTYSKTRLIAAAFFLLLFIFPTIVHAREGIIVYYNGSFAPNYRLFNSTEFTGQGNMLTLPNGTEWVVVKASPKTRTEMIAGFWYEHLGKTILTVQIFDGLKWGNMVNLSEITNTTSDDTRGFDIAYENNSGEALVVWNNNSQTPAYNVWNGTGWKFATPGGSALLADGCANTPGWIKLSSNPNSTNFNTTDEIIEADKDASGDVCGQVWNGTQWGAKVTFVTTETALGDSNFALGHEQKSGDGLVVFNAPATAGLQQYETLTGVPGRTWAAAATFVDVGMGSTTFTVANPSPNSDAIMYTYEEGGASDMGSDQWSGTAVGTNNEDAATTATGDGPIDATYLGINSTGLRVYNDNTNANFPRWQQCVSSSNCQAGTWTAVADVVSVNCGEAASLDFVELEIDTERNDSVLIVSTQTTHNKCYVLFDGATSTWVNTTYDVSKLGSGISLAAGKDFDFEYFRFAPVFGLGANGSFTSNPTTIQTGETTIFTANCTTGGILSSVNATIQDNRTGSFTISSIDTSAAVYVNVTNYTTPLLQGGSTANFTFLVNTTKAGTYNFRIQCESLNVTNPVKANSSDATSVLTVNQAFGYLNVTLNTPAAGSSTNVNQNTTFQLNATIKCVSNSTNPNNPYAICSEVNGTVRRNTTSGGVPILNVPNATGTPFHHILSGVGGENQTCGQVNASSQCQLNWTVNATGLIGSNWTLDVNFTSNHTSVISNDTANFVIIITAAAADTCTPPGGGADWTIEASDNCFLDTQTINVGRIFIKGNTGSVTFKNSNVISTDCRIEPSSGQKITLAILPTTTWRNAC